jgi:hypothetical protein
VNYCLCAEWENLFPGRDDIFHFAIMFRLAVGPPSGGKAAGAEVHLNPVAMLRMIGILPPVVLKHRDELYMSVLMCICVYIYI